MTGKVLVERSRVGEPGLVDTAISRFEVAHELRAIGGRRIVRCSKPDLLVADRVSRESAAMQVQVDLGCIAGLETPARAAGRAAVTTLVSRQGSVVDEVAQRFLGESATHG